MNSYDWEYFIGWNTKVISHLTRVHMVNIDDDGNMSIGGSIEDNPYKDVFVCDICNYRVQCPLKFKRHMEKEYKKKEKKGWVTKNEPGEQDW